ncbi:MAG: hypothetical protein K0S29_1356 [Gammaproteobacteria bacterium]|jgi:hypothetical protein|nr:hypothetical protein [Gammaproteobacteria bacterium]
MGRKGKPARIKDGYLSDSEASVDSKPRHREYPPVLAGAFHAAALNLPQLERAESPSSVTYRVLETDSDQSDSGPEQGYAYSYEDAVSAVQAADSESDASAESNVYVAGDYEYRVVSSDEESDSYAPARPMLYAKQLAYDSDSSTASMPRAEAAQVVEVAAAVIAQAASASPVVAANFSDSEADSGSSGSEAEAISSASIANVYSNAVSTRKVQAFDGLESASKAKPELSKLTRLLGF